MKKLTLQELAEMNLVGKQLLFCCSGYEYVHVIESVSVIKAGLKIVPLDALNTRWCRRTGSKFFEPNRHPHKSFVFSHRGAITKEDGEIQYVSADGSAQATISDPRPFPRT